MRSAKIARTGAEAVTSPGGDRGGETLAGVADGDLVAALREIQGEMRGARLALERLAGGDDHV